MADVTYDENGLAWDTLGGGFFKLQRRPDLDIKTPPPPPPPPDLADDAIQNARAAMRMRQLGGQGIGSTFLTGPMGLFGKAPSSTPNLLGS